MLNEKAVQEWRSGTIQEERIALIGKELMNLFLMLKRPDLQLQNLSKLSKLT
jgi:hypothetical protein